jgi:DNA/RNA endonuclease G (NUC1)
MQLSTHIPRRDAFHPELAVPQAERAAPAAGNRTYNRVHMTPADDESTRDAMNQSFSLEKMMPQNGTVNVGYGPTSRRSPGPPGTAKSML